MLRAVLEMLDQRLRLKTGTIERQGPGFAHAAHVGQRLFDDDAADALGVENFKHQIEIAVADLLRRNEFGRVFQTAKLLCIRDCIIRVEGSVLRHCRYPHYSGYKAIQTSIHLDFILTQ